MILIIYRFPGYTVHLQPNAALMLSQIRIAMQNENAEVWVYDLR